MFKRFEAADCSTSTQVKASVQRAIKSQIAASHPALDPETLDVIIPKKPPLTQYKAPGHLTVFCISDTGAPIFFQHRDGPILPTLRFVHMYPDLGWTTVTVDKGAIPFVLGGANIMCPGLTNPGSEMKVDLEKGQGVIVMAEGKEHAICVGTMKMSTEAVRTKNKGVGLDSAHFLGDGLFLTTQIN
eukprot:CAMPEP_0195521166 /NCGR_PEP_ID=MMETSP0794_2-20130614/18141_1 /TAXON_ID=515487 /ORGANISM="Stephanopyxis turris, Strain CCMP 815" /LENGTH=185 /DNA_ID=CAMNT_0040650667 /DNA_START=44 /DNA_END=601 /DNA_ORIENTATION=+